MGKTSYAVVSEIMKDHMGRYPTRAKLFEKWCYPSDGSPMSEAVLEAIEKMKEVATQNDENSIDCDMVHDTDDAFGKIMGNDKDGRVRMYGMGVKPTDIYGGKPSCDALFRKSMEEKEEMRAMKEKLEEVTALVHNRTRSGGQSEVERATFSSPNNWSSSQPVSRPIRVGAYVKLKSLGNLNEVVAIGIVKEIGCVRANGRDLGPVICEIVVQSTLKNDEMLIYPHDHIQTIGDSLGAPVAWSLSLFALDEDEN